MLQQRLFIAFQLRHPTNWREILDNFLNEQRSRTENSDIPHGLATYSGSNSPASYHADYFFGGDFAPTNAFYMMEGPGPTSMEGGASGIQEAASDREDGEDGEEGQGSHQGDADGAPDDPKVPFRELMGLSLTFLLK